MTFAGYEVSSKIRAAVRSLEERIHGLRGQAVLRYLELHLVDHCNLNCKGCGHFSPIAPHRFLDLEGYTADMRRLSQLFYNIRVIRLMGGEPLLFPKIAEAIAITKQFFPRADLRLITNGTLLPKMEQTFWLACRKHNVSIDLTQYPISLDVEKIRQLAAGNRVPIDFDECRSFFAVLNSRGDSDPAAAMKLCRSQYYTPFLQEGRLYLCPGSVLVRHYNEKFQTSIPVDSGIDIHDEKLNGRKILSLLERPIATCRHCTAGEYRTFDWAVSGKNKDEWIAE